MTKISINGEASQFASCHRDRILDGERILIVLPVQEEIVHFDAWDSSFGAPLREIQDIECSIRHRVDIDADFLQLTGRVPPPQGRLVTFHHESVAVRTICQDHFRSL